MDAIYKILDGKEPRDVTDLMSVDPEYITVAGVEGDLVREDTAYPEPNRPVQGASYCGDSRELLDELPDESVDLVVTSPPFGLRNKKQYGNEDPEDYNEWFLEFAKEVYRVLDDEGSFVVDIGGGWEKGKPVRSLYHFKLLLELADEDGKMATKWDSKFNLAQDLYWYNPAKLPTPAQWVTIERIRLKDAVDHVWWFTKGEGREKPDNRNVLKPYSDSQKSLMENGYKSRLRPSEHDISDKFDDPEKKDGAIRPNFWDVLKEAGMSEDMYYNLENVEVPRELMKVAIENDLVEELAEVAVNPYLEDEVREIPNTRSNTKYLKACKLHDREDDIHPARFPREFPEFFIDFVTEPGDVVLDIFSGSNTTGQVAQQMGRKWLAFEFNSDYVDTSRYRFMSWDTIEQNAVANDDEQQQLDEASVEPQEEAAGTSTN
ncbi:DNA-methyltransferase [Natronococcus occultus]|uniref:Type II methyltransferase n=1 Tax=Natronococcus occultus SP4 TaxID=694430 RepID=L0K117_9EURY|nr:site-specific DNA-methyltransferase [Natronococcus occultus]AGB38049.1 DNA modification methylase [Natronococcus occultus SP4]